MKRILSFVAFFATVLLLCSSEPVKVACIGDSITFGYGIKEHDTKAYPAVLQSMLGDGYEVRNYGISACTLMNSGDRPYMKTPIYKMALEYNPDIVTIMLGTNDTKPENWAHSEDFKKDCETMVKDFLDLPSKPRVYLCMPPKVAQSKWGINDSTIVASIIPTLIQVAGELRIELIDTHSALDGKPELYSDGIHPDPEGEKILAESIYERAFRSE